MNERPKSGAFYWYLRHHTYPQDHDVWVVAQAEEWASGMVLLLAGYEIGDDWTPDMKLIGPLEPPGVA